MSIDESRIRKHVNKCINFNGVMNKECHAGVNYTRKAGSSPTIRKLPCLLDYRDPEVAVECEYAEYPTREEAIAALEESDEAINALIASIGEKRCPQCGSGEWAKVGRCVYCNHCSARLYQGDLPG